MILPCLSVLYILDFFRLFNASLLGWLYLLFLPTLIIEYFGLIVLIKALLVLVLDPWCPTFNISILGKLYLFSISFSVLIDASPVNKNL